MHHFEKDNEMFGPRSVHTTFRKAGHYIFALGWVSFLGKLIIELLVYLHCYSIEFDLRYKKMSGALHRKGDHYFWAPVTGDENETYIAHWTHNVYHLSFVEHNQFLILMIAKELGNLLFSTWINAFACVYPAMPVLLQTLNTILWAFNVRYAFVTNLWVTFFWMTIVGGLYASSFANFMFLANAKTDLHVDLNL